MLEILVENSVFVFDLDDTLYSERSYERSGVKFVIDHLKEIKVISSNLENIEYYLLNSKIWITLIKNSIETHAGISEEGLLELYRNHPPNIKLYQDASLFLAKLKNMNAKIAIVTDGRSCSQRNKIKALGIDFYTDDIYISEEVGCEKPNLRSFKMIMEKFPDNSYVYFGDNLAKDFIAPNLLNWTTICMLDRGLNVHKQKFQNFGSEIPKFVMNTFDDICLL